MRKSLFKVLGQEGVKDHISKAREHIQKHKFQDALKELDKASRIEPNDGIVYVIKGVVLEFLGNQEEASAEFEKAIEIHPKYVDVVHNKAWVLSSLEAAELHDQAIKNFPNDSDALFMKATASLTLGNLEEALECLDEVVEIAPTAAAWTMKAQALFRLERFQDSISACDKALELEPHSISTFNAKSSSLMKLARYPEALELVNETLRLKPAGSNNLLFLCRKGEILSLQGENNLALECWNEAFEIYEKMKASESKGLPDRGKTWKYIAVEYPLAERQSEGGRGHVVPWCAKI
jgi:tetratricopeptide (TPR) repeat protein